MNIKEAVEKLNLNIRVEGDMEREIIVKRYGLNGFCAETQKVIAKKMGISRSYVSRIEKRALTKILREFIKNNKYDI